MEAVYRGFRPGDILVCTRDIPFVDEGTIVLLKERKETPYRIDVLVAERITIGGIPEHLFLKVGEI